MGHPKEHDVTTLLVVDDSPTSRQLTGGLLEAMFPCEVIYAADGKDALRRIGECTPDLVLTDLQMPEMNGLELVEALKHDFPMVPVVLMTAVGSEEIAAEALRRGAASYVPKRRLAEDLAGTVERVLAAAEAERQPFRLWHYLDEHVTAFTLRNDLVMIEAAVQHYQQALRALPLGDETERLRVGIAVEEALKNAYYHGNLEVRSVPPGGDGWDRDQAAAARLGEAPYADRQIRVYAQITRTEAVFKVRDDGSGFDVAAQAPANLAADNAVGRGINLMRSIMDEVRFNATGNEVTLVKRRAPEGEPESDLHDSTILRRAESR
jgi:CheY-like chemotaxis protein